MSEKVGVVISVEETLKYRRGYKLNIPKELFEDEDAFNKLLDDAEKFSDAASDICYYLADQVPDIEIAGSVEDDFSSPHDTEIEIDDYMEISS